MGDAAEDSTSYMPIFMCTFSHYVEILFRKTKTEAKPI